MVMHLMEKGVEDDPIGMEREMKRKEVIIESQSRRARSQGLEEEVPYSGLGKRRLNVNTIEEEEEDGKPTWSGTGMRMGVRTNTWKSRP